jgi:hypothetical protein
MLTFQYFHPPLGSFSLKVAILYLTLLVFVLLASFMASNFIWDPLFMLFHFVIKGKVARGQSDIFCQKGDVAEE